MSIMFNLKTRRQIHLEQQPHQAGGAATTSFSKTGTKEFIGKRVIASTSVISHCWTREEARGQTPGLSLMSHPASSALGFSNIWTNSWLHNGDYVRTQLWFRQDGELQGVPGDGGGGWSSLQASQTRLRQQVWESFHVLFASVAAVAPDVLCFFRSPCDCKRQSALKSRQEHPRHNFLIILFHPPLVDELSLAFVPAIYIRNRFPGTKVVCCPAVKEGDCCAHYPKSAFERWGERDGVSHKRGVYEIKGPVHWHPIGAEHF